MKNLKINFVQKKKFARTIEALIVVIILSTAVIFTGNVKKANSVSEISATEPTESLGITQETEAGEENRDEHSVESVVTDESTISSGSNSMSNDSQEKNSSNRSTANTGDAASKSDYETDIMTNDDSGADDSAVSPDSSNVQNVPNSGNTGNDSNNNSSNNDSSDDNSDSSDDSASSSRVIDFPIIPID